MYDEDDTLLEMETDPLLQESIEILEEEAYNSPQPLGAYEATLF